MARVGLAVGGMALVLLGGAALTFNGDGWNSHSGHLSNELGEVHGVHIDAGNGDVRIRHEPGTRARIEQTVQRWGSWVPWGREDAPVDAPAYRLESGRLQLDGDCGWNCSVDYVVTLPSQVPVSGSLGSGAVDVLGMSSVDVRTGSGDIQVRGVDGAVRAHARSGSVSVFDLGGRGPVATLDLEAQSGDVNARDVRADQVTARTGSGGIDLSLDEVRAVRAKAGSGDVMLRVPTGAYQVDAQSSSGDESVEVDQDPAAGRSLHARTGSGDISIAS